MKKLLLSVLAIALCGAVWAQDDEMTPKQVAKSATKRFKKEISLTKEQEPKFEAIILERFTQIEKIDADKSLDKKTIAQQRAAAVEKSKKELTELLTPEQMKTYSASVLKTPLKPKATPNKGGGGNRSGGSDDGFGGGDFGGGGGGDF